MRGVSIREERTRLIEGNITENPNVMSNQTPKTISLLFRVIAKTHWTDYVDGFVLSQGWRWTKAT
jgi:hypothetical protein